MKKLLHVFCFLLVAGIGNTTLLAQATASKVKNQLSQITPLKLEATILTQAHCNYSNDGSILIKAQGGNLPYQYFEIEGRTGSQRSNHGNVFSKLNPDIYTIKVVDADGQEAYTQITLKGLNPTPRADFEVERSGNRLKFLNKSENKENWVWHFGEDQLSYDESPTPILKKKYQEVCLTVDNGCKVKDFYCETVNVHHLLASNEDLIGKDFELGVQNNQSSPFKVQVFPNPTTDQLRLSYDKMIGLESIKIYNTTGKLLKTVVPESDTNSTLSLTGFAPGMYLVSLQGTSGRSTIKINKVAR